MSDKPPLGTYPALEAALRELDEENFEQLYAELTDLARQVAVVEIRKFSERIREQAANREGEAANIDD